MSRRSDTFITVKERTLVAMRREASYWEDVDPAKAAWLRALVADLEKVPHVFVKK